MNTHQLIEKLRAHEVVEDLSDMPVLAKTNYGDWEVTGVTCDSQYIYLWLES